MSSSQTGRKPDSEQGIRPATPSRKQRPRSSSSHSPVVSQKPRRREKLEAREVIYHDGVEYYPIIRIYQPRDHLNDTPSWKVHWWGYDSSEDTWEDADHLQDLTTGGYPMIWLFHYKHDIPLPYDLLRPPDDFPYDDYDEEVEVKVKAEKVEMEERKIKVENMESDRKDKEEELKQKAERRTRRKGKRKGDDALEVFDQHGFDDGKDRPRRICMTDERDSLSGLARITRSSSKR